MSIELKTPWYKYYDGVREHLEYPNIIIWNILKIRRDMNDRA